MTIDTRPSWWGEFSLAPGEVGRWRSGPLTVWIERGQQAWRIATQRDLAHPADTEGFDTCEGIPPDVLDTCRFAFRHTGDTVSLQPALADRPVIFRPLQALSVPPGETCQLYLASPLWLTVRAGEPRQSLADLPLNRPSDTWFGPPVKPGGLAYAVDTPVHTVPPQVLLPWHAVTPLVIQNATDATLPVQRLNLPVPLFALYHADDGRLWTEGVTLECNSTDDALFSLRLGKGLPAQAGAGRRVCEARQAGERNLVIQAVSRLLG